MLFQLPKAVGDEIPAPEEKLNLGPASEQSKNVNQRPKSG
jgi:hypothetical protein